MLTFEHPTFRDVLSRLDGMGFIWVNTEETPQRELDLVEVLGLNVHQLSSRPRVTGEVS